MALVPKGGRLITSTTEAKAKGEALLESIGDGVIATDQKGRVVVINKAAENLLGFTSAEIIGKFLVRAISMQDAQGNQISDKLSPITLALTTGKIITTTSGPNYYLVRKDGTKFPVAVTVAPVLLNSKAAGVTVVFRDIAKEQELDRAKIDFVSTASHQLRTPVSIINWYVEMLLGGDVGSLASEQKKYLEEIYKNSKRMGDLIDALLIVSRLELGTVAIEPKAADLEAIAKSAWADFEVWVKHKKLSIKHRREGGPLTLAVDPHLMRIVFQNLFSNAIKYSPDGGVIECSIERRESDILIAVKDHGVGIPEKDQPKIFTKFFRADNARIKEPEGTGLGLYIMKSILGQAGGRVWFKSAEGKGTTFYVALSLSGMTRHEGPQGLEPPAGV